MVEPIVYGWTLARSSIKVFRCLIWWKHFLISGVDSKKLFNIVGKFKKISLKGVVYYDQLFGAARTRKLVEILFSAIFNLSLV